MVLPLMPKATAVWLIENTTLSFDQIADFCGMHPLEVQGIADGEVAIGIVGKSPVESGQLSMDTIHACEKDASARLSLADDARKYMSNKVKGSRYTPVARRQDKPDALAWLLKNHPELGDAALVRLIGTTKSTIEAIRSKSHWNSQNIKPKDPVMLGLCTQVDLEASIAKARKAAEAAANPKPKKSPRKAAAKKPAAAKAAKPVKAAAPKKAAATKKPAAAKKSTVKKSTAKKPAAKKTPAKKAAPAKKTTAKKAPAKKAAVAKKPAAKKTPTPKTTAKKTSTAKPAKKPAAAKAKKKAV
jgi:uncharacterized protein